MKKRTNKLWIAILFLAGFSLLLYPLVANEWNNYRQKKLIGIYEEEVAAKEAAGTIDYWFLYFADFLRLAKNNPAAMIMIRQPPIVKIVVPMPPVEGREDNFVFKIGVSSTAPF